jgi:hypothetical protein
MAGPADGLALARARVDRFLDDLIDVELFEELGPAATTLYKEQYAKKENPYGEAWPYRPGDEKRRTSNYKFGKAVGIERGAFELIVAAPNAKRSCVPFEPRGLGAWRPKFDEIVQARARLLFRRVRP